MGAETAWIILFGKLCCRASSLHHYTCTRSLRNHTLSLRRNLISSAVTLYERYLVTDKRQVLLGPVFTGHLKDPGMPGLEDGAEPAKSGVLNGIVSVSSAILIPRSLCVLLMF